ERRSHRPAPGSGTGLDVRDAVAWRIAAGVTAARGALGSVLPPPARPRRDPPGHLGRRRGAVVCLQLPAISRRARPAIQLVFSRITGRESFLLGTAIHSYPGSNKAHQDGCALELVPF